MGHIPISCVYTLQAAARGCPQSMRPVPEHGIVFVLVMGGSV